MSEEHWCSCSLMNLFVVIACSKKICLTCANKLKIIVSVLLHMVNHTDPSQSVKSFKTASKHFFSTMSEVKSLVPLVDVILIKGLLVGMTGPQRGLDPELEPPLSDGFLVCLLSFAVVEDPAVRGAQPAVHRLSADVVQLHQQHG